MISSPDYLVNHALENVWCSPGQDRQYILSPERITDKWGALATIRLGRRNYNLPSQSDRYHVFVIGDLPPVILGMITNQEKWIALKAHCNVTSLLIDVYFNNGLHFPLHRSYLLYSRTGQLVLACKDTNKITDIKTERLFMRFRSNAWFDNNVNIPANKGIEVDGIEYISASQFSSFQLKWRTAKNAVGKAYAFVNGVRVTDINNTTAAMGDLIEYVRDASVKEVLEFKLRDLNSFHSLLDGKSKYLVAREAAGDIIDYLDDVDFYILNYVQSANYRGVYFHQNDEGAVRMVTHQDYSIDASYVEQYLLDMGWQNSSNLKLEVVIRNSGWDRPLVDEHHRIKELYKLDYSSRLKALRGEFSNVEVWRAENLENSAYVKIMGSKPKAITRDLVEQAYGYNAISKLVGNTPIKVEVGQTWVKLPYALRSESTVYEYDTYGKLIGWYPNTYSREYPIRNPACRYIEAYSGKAGLGLGTIYNDSGYTLEPDVEYRFYVANIWNGESLENWRDVTGNTQYVSIVNNQVVWNIDRSKFVTAIRTDKTILSYNLNLNYRDSLLVFSLQAKEKSNSGVVEIENVRIPVDSLDIFLNGWQLIEGIGYHVKWPEICIVDKNHLAAGSLQKVTVRARGFCKSDMSRSLPRDVGYVANNTLSRNAYFNVRDDKVSKIVIGGALYTREEVGFSEDGQVLVGDIENGTPYQVIHPIIPLGDMVTTDTYLFRERSREVDRVVENFLTEYLPEVLDEVNPIPSWYKLFSPFCTKLIYDMINGILPMTEFMGEYSLEYVRQRLAGYEWILEYEPAVKGYDDRYLVLHPHPETDPIGLNIYQYRLLSRAVDVFLDNKVPLTRDLVIVEEGYEYEQR